MMAGVLYFAFLNRSLAKLRKLPSKTVHYVFTETQVESTHDLGESKYSWKIIERVWRFPEVWLLFYGRNAFFTLPVDAASREALTFIEEQVKRHGGKIK